MLAAVAILLSAALLRGLDVPRGQIQVILIGVTLIAMWAAYRVLTRQARNDPRNEPTLH